MNLVLELLTVGILDNTIFFFLPPTILIRIPGIDANDNLNVDYSLNCAYCRQQKWKPASLMRYTIKRVIVLRFSGSALIKVGQCEQRLGSIEREFINNANQCFVSPLQKFLDGEMKSISKERNLLQMKR